MNQSAASKILGIKIPVLATAEVHVLAPLIGCALKMEVSVPHVNGMDLIHLAMVPLDVGPFSFVVSKRPWASLLNQHS